MSGPVTQQDTGEGGASARGPVVELIAARPAEVGSMTVRRALPRRGRRTVGAWCFADHFGPVLPAEGAGMSIGPHPHMGLHTVTWLLAGAMRHTDSLGSDQVIRPGQLNLMTAGRGVAHAEQSVAPGAEHHGVQLWVAQPEATRHGDPGFEHHADLPSFDAGRTRVTVILGELDEACSPARTDTPIVGAELRVAEGTTRLPLRPAFEHALLVLDGSVQIAEASVAPGTLAYLGTERDHLVLSAEAPARAMLLGGEPFGEELLMWWNFVARSRDEIDQAQRDWQEQAPRFGTVSSPLARIPAPTPVWAQRP